MKEKKVKCPNCNKESVIYVDFEFEKIKGKIYNLHDYPNAYATISEINRKSKYFRCKNCEHDFLIKEEELYD